MNRRRFIINHSASCPESIIQLVNNVFLIISQNDSNMLNKEMQVFNAKQDMHAYFIKDRSKRYLDLLYSLAILDDDTYEINYVSKHRQGIGWLPLPFSTALEAEHLVPIIASINMKFVSEMDQFSVFWESFTEPDKPTAAIIDTITNASVDIDMKTAFYILLTVDYCLNYIGDQMKEYNRLVLLSSLLDIFKVLADIHYMQLWSPEFIYNDIFKQIYLAFKTHLYGVDCLGKGVISSPLMAFLLNIGSPSADSEFDVDKELSSKGINDYYSRCSAINYRDLYTESDIRYDVQHYFCKRCLVFDCQRHGVGENGSWDINRSPLYNLSHKMSTIDCFMKDGISYCGVNCFKHHIARDNQGNLINTKNTAHQAAVGADILTASQGKCGNDPIVVIDLIPGHDENTDKVEGADHLNIKSVLCEQSRPVYNNCLACVDDSCMWNKDEIELLTHSLMYCHTACEVALLIETKTCLDIHVYIESHLSGLEKAYVPRSLTPPIDLNPISYSQYKSDCEKLQNEIYKRLVSWENISSNHLYVYIPMTDPSEYIPCNHPARLCDDTCSCVMNSTFCEKFCSCDRGCKLRFKGCKCTKTCTETSCICRVRYRECDFDICHPTSSGNASKRFLPTKLHACDNADILLQSQKRVFVGDSEVAGYGVFAEESFGPRQFVGEYVGEIISFEEGEERGVICDKLGLNYLFKSSKDNDIDAIRLGNLTRFLNHSTKPNCVARTVMVNGDNHIGIYANTQIPPGTELFFNYNLPKDKSI